MVGFCYILSPENSPNIKNDLSEYHSSIPSMHAPKLISDD